ncbi:MAG: hypothetical protein WC917_03075 [Bacilli bacterium]|jgi:hypothetical protein
MIKIKKIYVAGFFGFVCLVSAYDLFQIFFRTLVESDLLRLITPISFVVSLFFSINFWSNYHLKTKLAEEVAKELTEQKLKDEPNFFDHKSPDSFRNQMENHLLEKLEKENYVLFAKKT